MGRDDAAMGAHAGDQPELRRLHPGGADPATTCQRTPSVAGGSGSGPGDAGRVVDALKSSADQEFSIAERLASKARQAYALAAGVFVVSQTVAFGSFEAAKLSSDEKRWIILAAVAAVAALGLATASVLRADDVVDSGDLPLDRLEDDLNAAYDGDQEVLGRLGGYYLGVVRSRRNANSVRRSAYKRARGFVALSLAFTVLELVVALIARTN